MKFEFSVSEVPPMLAVVALYLLLGGQSSASPLEFLLAAFIATTKWSNGSAA